MEAGEEELLLKPLVSNGKAYADNPAGYKRMDYGVLYGSTTRIWISMESPGN